MATATQHRPDSKRFEEHGYCCPLRALPAAEATDCRGRLEAFEARQGHPLAGAQRHKCHLLFPWLNELVRRPAIVDAVAALLGPDLLCWNTNFFTKPARDAHFVSWHQDATYFGLSDAAGVTAWVALTPSTPENGCMRVVAGSHRLRQLPHVERPATLNMLSRGQQIAVEVDEAQAVDLVLAPGEMSLHDLLIVHGSGPNRSAERRIGVAIRYIPTAVRQIGGRDSATLVRGTDRLGHFDPEPVPADEYDEATVAAHEAVVRNHTLLLMAGAGAETLK